MFADEEITASVRAPAALFHHIDITAAIVIKIVRSITGMFNKGILIQREHIVGFKTADFDLPVILFPKEEYRIIDIY